MNEKPVIVDDIAETDVYVAALELRSVGSSKNMFPALRYSHHFTKEPSQIPYAYQAIMKIAEATGAVFVEQEVDVEPPSGADADAAALAMEASLASQTEKDDDTNS